MLEILNELRSQRRQSAISQSCFCLPLLQTERTALHLAAHFQQCDVIDALLASNAPTDVKDQQGAVPLHLAVQTGDAKCVLALLGRGNKVFSAFLPGFLIDLHHLQSMFCTIGLFRRLLVCGRVELSACVATSVAVSTDSPHRSCALCEVRSDKP